MNFRFTFQKFLYLLFLAKTLAYVKFDKTNDVIFFNFYFYDTQHLSSNTSVQKISQYRLVLLRYYHKLKNGQIDKDLLLWFIRFYKLALYHQEINPKVLNEIEHVFIDKKTHSKDFRCCDIYFFMISTLNNIAFDSFLKYFREYNYRRIKIITYNRITKKSTYNITNYIDFYYVIIDMFLDRLAQKLDLLKAERLKEDKKLMAISVYVLRQPHFNGTIVRRRHVYMKFLHEKLTCRACEDERLNKEKSNHKNKKSITNGTFYEVSSAKKQENLKWNKKEKIDNTRKIKRYEVDAAKKIEYLNLNRGTSFKTKAKFQNCKYGKTSYAYENLEPQIIPGTAKNMFFYALPNFRSIENIAPTPHRAINYLSWTYWDSSRNCAQRNTDFSKENNKTGLRNLYGYSNISNTLFFPTKTEEFRPVIPKASLLYPENSFLETEASENNNNEHRYAKEAIDKQCLLSDIQKYDCIQKSCASENESMDSKSSDTPVQPTSNSIQQSDREKAYNDLLTCLEKFSELPLSPSKKNSIISLLPKGKPVHHGLNRSINSSADSEEDGEAINHFTTVPKIVFSDSKSDDLSDVNDLKQTAFTSNSKNSEEKPNENFLDIFNNQVFECQFPSCLNKTKGLLNPLCSLHEYRGTIYEKIYNWSVSNSATSSLTNSTDGETFFDCQTEQENTKNELFEDQSNAVILAGRDVSHMSITSDLPKFFNDSTLNHKNGDLQRHASFRETINSDYCNIIESNGKTKTFCTEDSNFEQKQTFTIQAAEKMPTTPILSDSSEGNLNLNQVDRSLSQAEYINHSSINSLPSNSLDTALKKRYNTDSPYEDIISADSKELDSNKRFLKIRRKKKKNNTFNENISGEIKYNNDGKISTELNVREIDILTKHENIELNDSKANHESVDREEYYFLTSCSKNHLKAQVTKKDNVSAKKNNAAKQSQLYSINHFRSSSEILQNSEQIPYKKEDDEQISRITENINAVKEKNDANIEEEGNIRHISEFLGPENKDEQAISVNIQNHADCNSTQGKKIDRDTNLTGISAITNSKIVCSLPPIYEDDEDQILNPIDKEILAKKLQHLGSLINSSLGSPLLYSLDNGR